MKTLTLYITRTILTSIILVIGVLAGIYIIFTLMPEINNVGRGHYTALAAFIYVVLTIPNSLYIGLPMACLIGTLMGLGYLASHSELIAMRAAGVSIKRIAGAVAVPGIVMMLICFILGAYLGPKSMHIADQRRTSEISGQAFVMTNQATWLKDGTNIVYVGHSISNQSLRDIRIYQTRADHLRSILSAKVGEYKHHAWLLKDVRQIMLTPKQVEERNLPQLIWPNLISPVVLQVMATSTQTYTLAQLMDYIHYRQRNALNASNAQLKLWNILFQPIATLILMLMAVPFVFGPLRSSTTGLRLVAGLILGFTFFIVNRFFGPFSVLYHVPAALGSAFPLIIFGAVLLWLIRRIS